MIVNLILNTAGVDNDFAMKISLWNLQHNLKNKFLDEPRRKFRKKYLSIIMLIDFIP